MENLDKVQDILGNFVKSPSQEIPPLLEEYLREVAKTGKTVFPWQQLKTLFVQKFEQVMEQFHKEDPSDQQVPLPNVDNTKYDEMKSRIIDAIERFTGAPFTVQRICELVTQPKKHYTKCDKFLRGLEKNVMVVSTVDPSGRKIVSESRALVNGLDLNGMEESRDNFNDISDEQPFGSGPQVDWAGNNVATVWPANLPSENQSNSNSVVNGCHSDIADEKSKVDIELSAESKVEEMKNETESGETLVVSDCVVKDSVPKSANQSASGHQDEDDIKTKLSENTDQSDKTDSSAETDHVLEQSVEQTQDTESKDSETRSKTPEDSMDRRETTTGEKHARDFTDTTSEEPPEKKLKTDTNEPQDKKEDSVKESADVQTTDLDDVPDAEESEHTPHEGNEETKTAESEISQETDSEQKSNEDVTSPDIETSDKPSDASITDAHGDSADIELAGDGEDVKSVTAGDNASEESATGSKDMTETVPDSTVSSDTDDNRRETEVMETDGAADKTEEEQTDPTNDESEPMDHD